MPKLKSHKGLLKRIRLTAKKKVKFPQHGKRHINSHFTGAQVRKLRGRKKCAKGADMRRLEAMMHMRLTPSDRVRPCCTGACASASTSKGIKDDVSLIGGVGAILVKKLATAGITSLSQIAAWKAEDIAKFDVTLGLRGRIVREEWVDQAKELLAGKAPRAKTDRARA